MTAQSIGLVSVEKAHSILGPSSAERWFNCPGSPRMLAQCPPQAPSEYAAEGTVAHSVLADLLEMELGRQPVRELLGETREADGFKFEVTEEMLDAVNVCVEYVLQVKANYCLTNDCIEVEVEVPLTGDDWDGTPRFGRVDIRILIPCVKLIVIDYKHGRGKLVKVEENKQILDYMLGSFLTLKGDPDWKPTQLESVVVQPRCRGGGIMVWQYHVSRLATFEQEVSAAVERTKAPDAPLIAGEWCVNSFCSAQRTCPANIKYCSEGSNVDYAKVDLPVLADKAKFPVPQEMPDELIADILDRTDNIKTLLKLVEEEAERRIVTLGKDIRGYHVVETIGNRKYADALAAEKAVQQKIMELTEPTTHEEEDAALDLIYKPRQLKTPAQLEKVEGLKPLVSELTIRPVTGRALQSVNKKGKKQDAMKGVVIDLPLVVK